MNTKRIIPILAIVAILAIGCTPEAQRLDAEANKIEAETGRIEAETEKTETETAQETQRETITTLKGLIEGLQEALRIERAQTQKWEERYHALVLEILKGKKANAWPWILATVVSVACAGTVAFIALRRPATPRVVMIQPNGWQGPASGWLPEPRGDVLDLARVDQRREIVVE
jgi:hypothetical protein